MNIKDLSFGTNRRFYSQKFIKSAGLGDMIAGGAKALALPAAVSLLSAALNGAYQYKGSKKDATGKSAHQRNHEELERNVMKMVELAKAEGRPLTYEEKRLVSMLPSGKAVADLWTENPGKAAKDAALYGAFTAGPLVGLAQSVWSQAKHGSADFSSMSEEQLESFIKQAFDLKPAVTAVGKGLNYMAHSGAHMGNASWVPRTLAGAGVGAGAGLVRGALQDRPVVNAQTGERQGRLSLMARGALGGAAVGGVLGAASKPVIDRLASQPVASAANPGALASVQDWVGKKTRGAMSLGQRASRATLDLSNPDHANYLRNVVAGNKALRSYGTNPVLRENWLRTEAGQTPLAEYQMSSPRIDPGPGVGYSEG